MCVQVIRFGRHEFSISCSLPELYDDGNEFHAPVADANEMDDSTAATCEIGDETESVRMKQLQRSISGLGGRLAAVPESSESAGTGAQFSQLTLECVGPSTR